VAGAEVLAVVRCAAAGAVVCGAPIAVLFGDGFTVVREVVALGRGLVAGLRVVVAAADAPLDRAGPRLVVGLRVRVAEDHGAQPEGARVLLVGAGGAGSAIAIALLEAGVGALIIHDADRSRVATLLELLKDFGRGRVSAGPPDPTGCDLVCNATPLGMEDGDPLPIDPALLTPSMFVGDVIAGHGVTPFLAAAQAAGCRTANGGHMVEAAQDVMADFMMLKSDASRVVG
jgi:hypothetical protein